MLLWPEKSSAGFYWPLAAAAAPPIMPATSRRLAACSSRSLLAATLALLSGGFQLAVAFRDFLLTPRQHFLRRDVADGTVQADVVVDEYGTNMAGRIWGRETNMGDEYGDEYGDRRDVPTPVSFTLGGDLRQNCSRFRHRIGSFGDGSSHYDVAGAGSDGSGLSSYARLIFMAGPTDPHVAGNDGES